MGCGRVKGTSAGGSKSSLLGTVLFMYGGLESAGNSQNSLGGIVNAWTQGYVHRQI